MSKAKKKAVKKMKVETIPTIQFTEEQFNELKALAEWNHPLSNLESIKEHGDASKLELGFLIGEVYKEFSEYISKIEKIINEVQPDEEEDYDLSSYEDEEDDENL